MNTLPTNKIMKQRVYSILIGMALSLTIVSTGHAMSTFVSLSIEPEWPTTSNPGTVILYKVTAVVREGSGLLEVSLSSLGLPAGATVEFSPSPLRFTGHVPYVQTAMMTVTCPEVTPTDTYPFTLTGDARREALTLTNQVEQELYSLIVGPPVLILDRLSGNDLRLRGKGTTGQTYKIESTPSLTQPDWTTLGTSTADGNGRFTFFTAQAAGAPMRFYRAVESAQSQPPAP
jgi:hypothetical protein